MQISRRLAAVSAMVTSGSIAADIGTDHAYIPIYLVQSGQIAHAIAMDINRGPLERAQEHIMQYGLQDQIETRLSDGLEALLPGEADCFIIAGMGGPLMIRILSDAPEQVDMCRELILQPQSEIRLARAWLEQNDWQIVQEEIIYEDGKFYPMMKAVHRDLQGERSQDGGANASTVKYQKSQDQNGEKCLAEDQRSQSVIAIEQRYGPFLLQMRHPVLKDYLLRERELNQRILASLKGQTGEMAVKRRQEIETELEFAEVALARYQQE